MLRLTSVLVALFCFCQSSLRAEDASPAPATPTTKPLAAADAPVWQSDYFTAYTAAQEQRKLLLVYFASDTENGACQQFEREALADPATGETLRNYVLVRLAVSAKLKLGETESRVLDHAAFAEMLGQPGLAVVDLAHLDTPNYGQVVSVLPFSFPSHATKEGFAALLALPAGSLTQRTLTYAVRMHRERPQSAAGAVSALLMEESQRAASYQAQIRRQGHHNWESRFHRISASLPDGLLAQEVAAESWPGQRLVESAYELVHSWRQSPGHWRAVSNSQPLFGYDMQHGSNGIWYGVGLFGNRG